MPTFTFLVKKHFLGVDEVNKEQEIQSTKQELAQREFDCEGLLDKFDRIQNEWNNYKTAINETKNINLEYSFISFSFF